MIEPITQQQYISIWTAMVFNMPFAEPHSDLFNQVMDDLDWYRDDYSILTDDEYSPAHCDTEEEARLVNLVFLRLRLRQIEDALAEGDTYEEFKKSIDDFETMASALDMRRGILAV